ncbi:MAG TPA: hypothetical protein VL283_03225 [Candidatus Baltobacteraceae bacterium]|nr:hypothetical protein [Candidatus Baltobacteraceae bacterium]
MKRAYILFAILVALAVVAYRPVMTYVRGGTKTGASSCEYEGRSYRLAEQRRAADGCNVCACGENGWSCTKLACRAGEGSGTISGTLSYPSEAIPAQRVCALNLEDDATYCQQTVAGATAYAIPAPAGEYFVYASLEDDVTGKRAYDSEFVRCGLKAECKDHTPVKIALAPDGTATADPQDWYAVGQFDLVSVTPSRYEYLTHNYYPTSVFSVMARGLSKVELFSSPYPPDPAHRDDPPFSPIGEASLVSEERDVQTWTLPVPPGFQAMEVRAKGTSENGEYLWSRDLRIVRPIDTAAASSTVQ